MGCFFQNYFKDFEKIGDYDIKVDLEMIASVMEDVARVDMDYYLDKKTGELIFIPEEVSRYIEEEDENLRKELPDWEKEGVKLA